MKNKIKNNDQSVCILKTYQKLKLLYSKFESIDIGILSCVDIQNIKKVYYAAIIFGSMGMFSEKTRLIAMDEIRSFIGNYNYSIEIYRTFIYAYNDVLYYIEQKKKSLECDYGYQLF